MPAEAIMGKQFVPLPTRGQRNQILQLLDADSKTERLDWLKAEYLSF